MAQPQWLASNRGLPTDSSFALADVSCRRFAEDEYVRFGLWTAVAVALWTPLIVLGSQQIIQPLWQPWRNYVGDAFLAGLLLFIFVATGVWLLKQILLPQRRKIWRQRWQRRHHEWWPSWTLYLPLLPLFAYLAIRHRTLRAPFACNPGLLDGGLMGESKSLLQAMAPGVPWLRWLTIAEASARRGAAPIKETQAAVGSRLTHLLVWMRQENIGFPIILKPDVGERGGDIKLTQSPVDAAQYFFRHPQRTLAQEYHPGPVEIGIFWARTNKTINSTHNSILSITDKEFPVVIGDGESTLERLIANHHRFRNQYDLHCQRHAQRLTYIPAAGEAFLLTGAGNHSQGCCFKDGMHLLTPHLQAQCETWMAQQNHLHYGRFDVRAASYEDVQAGRNLAVIEMNGLSSEPTALYDPSWSYLRALRTLAACWQQAFCIGARMQVGGTRVRNLFAVGRAIRQQQRLHNRPRDIAR